MLTRDPAAPLPAAPSSSLLPSHPHYTDLAGMREASVLPGSGGRRWGCLKIPILHACPSTAAWRATSLTPSSTWRCLPTGAPFSPSSSSLLGSVHHASVGLGCQDQGRSLVLVLTDSSWGQWRNEQSTPSVPALTPLQAVSASQS